MTVFAQTAGKRSIAAVSLADSSEYDLITPKDGSTATLESVIACNTSGAIREFSMVVDLGGSSYSVAFAKEVPAGDFFHLTDHNVPIAAGSVLRVQSDAAGLDVTAVYILNSASGKTS